MMETRTQRAAGAACGVNAKQRNAMQLQWCLTAHRGDWIIRVLRVLCVSKPFHTTSLTLVE